MTKENSYTHHRVKNQNMSLVLKLIYTKRANTRSELARLTGLSKMTLSNIVAELLAEDYISERDRSIYGASQGRIPIELEISPRAPHAVGVFLGRVECLLVLSTIDAKFIKTTRFDIKSDMTKEILLDHLRRGYMELVSETRNRVIGIGIASIGPIDKMRGLILNPPDFFGMKNISIKEFFEEISRLPVYFDNNMNAAALAEKMFGNGKTLSDLLYIGVMHGVGAGIIAGGNLLNGPSGVNGELGHTTINFDGAPCQCGNRGCLELYATIPRIVEGAISEMKQAGIMIDEKTFDWPQLVTKAREGEYYSLRALNRLCEYLVVGIVNLVNLLDSEEVFLGHDIALAEGLIEKKLEQIVNKRIFANNIKTLRIRMSAFGTQAPLVGSVCLVLNNLLRNGD